MPFLGFSLRDDNFLRIVDQVRRAVHPGDVPSAGADRLGSALMLYDNPLLSDLWRDEIEDRALRAMLLPLLRASADVRKWPAVRDLLVRLGGTIDGRVGKA